MPRSSNQAKQWYMNPGFQLWGLGMTLEQKNLFFTTSVIKKTKTNQGCFEVVLLFRLRVGNLSAAFMIFKFVCQVEASKTCGMIWSSRRHCTVTIETDLFSPLWLKAVIGSRWIIRCIAGVDLNCNADKTTDRDLKRFALTGCVYTYVISCCDLPMVIRKSAVNFPLASAGWTATSQVS